MTDNSFPTEIIDLPSQGHFYAEEHPLSSGKVEMKYMTAREEDILTSVNLIQQGVVLDTLLQSLIVDKKINIDDLLIGDKNALVLASRVLAYGKEYDFTFIDKYGEKVNQKADLTKINETKLDFTDIPKGVNSFSYELPKTKRKLTFQLPTHKLEKQIENEVEALNKVYKDSNIDKTLSTKLKYYITSVDGSTDKKDINNFVDNEFLSVDSNEFRNYMTSITPDVEFSVEVKNSRGEKERVAVPMTAKFFWPNSQL
jgi:hypothetical protein